jgi:hypothetical protein
MRNELQHLVSNWLFDIPFERSVRLNLITLERLREGGLTWSSIATALTQAGARHKNSHPISARQMNSVFLRVQKATRMTLIADPPRRLQNTVSEVPPAPVKSARQAKSATKILGSFAKAPSEHSASHRRSGLAQRLTEARQMRGAARIEYDD